MIKKSDKSLSSMLLLGLLLSCNQQGSKEEIISKSKHLKNLDNLIEKVDTNRSISKKELNDTDDYTNIRKIKCLQDEKQVNLIVRNTIQNFEKSFEQKNLEGVLSSFENTIYANSISDSSLKLNTSVDGLDIFSYQTTPVRRLDQNNLKKEIKNYINSFSSVEDVKLDIVKYAVNSKNRLDKNLNFSTVKLTGFLDIRGTNLGKNRVQNQSVIEIEFKNTNNEWKIVSWNKLKSEKVISKRAPAFSDITKESKDLNGATAYLREEAIRRGGYAISSSDINGDKNADLIIGAKGDLVSYIGDGKGGYSSNAKSGIDNEKFVKAAIVFDYDNNGIQDLGITKFTFSKYESDLVVYKGLGGGKFSIVPEMVKKVNETDYAMPAAVADYDNDGYLDFYVGFPGEKDFTVLFENNSLARKVPQGMFFNEKDKNGRNLFKEKPDVLKLSMDDPGYLSALFPHSSLAIDYDRDMDVDLVVIDDRNNFSPVYKNLGNREFTNVAKPISLSNRGYGMGVASGDLNGDGHIDFAMTNVNFASASRINKSCDVHWYIDKFTFDDKGLRVFINNGDNTFKEETASSGLGWAGEGLAGVEFLDYNNDGLLDIYVANGLWSGSVDDRNQDLSSLFSRAAYLNMTKSNELYVENKSSFLNYLKLFKGDLQFNDKSLNHAPSLAGFQKNRLYRNLGNGKFIDVAFVEGVDTSADGYVITTADINNDNNLDIVLRNGDPGYSIDQFPVVQVFKNNLKIDNSVILTLEGSSVNRDAIGAEVIAKVGKKTLVRQLIANNGSAQSFKMLHFGLGKKSKIDHLEVRWGKDRKSTIIQNVRPGRYNLKEKSPKQLVQL